MSKATFTPGKPAVTKTVEVSPAEPGKVVLELSPEEAQFLADLLGTVGGDPFRSRRSHQISLSKSLRGCGFNFTSMDSPKYDHAGTVMFSDEEAA